MWFALALAAAGRGVAQTDAIIVPTGAGGRIERGLELLRGARPRHLLVTGVDPEVKPGEFAAEYKVSPKLMNCCITLDFAAVDTRSNASRSADVEWRRAGYKRLRLVTSDWHMRRAAFELGRTLPR